MYNFKISIAHGKKNDKHRAWKKAKIDKRRVYVYFSLFYNYCCVITRYFLLLTWHNYRRFIYCGNEVLKY